MWPCWYVRVKSIVISTLAELKCSCSTKCKTLHWWSIVVSSPSVYIEYRVYQIPQSVPALSVWRRLWWAGSKAMTPTLIVNVAPTQIKWSGPCSHSGDPANKYRPGSLHFIDCGDGAGQTGLDLTKKVSCLTLPDPSLTTYLTSSWVLISQHQGRVRDAHLSGGAVQWLDRSLLMQML